MIVSDEPLVPCSFLASVVPSSGALPGDGVENVDVTFDATGFEPGTYDCELIIFSNAVNEPRYVVPLQMVVAQEVSVDILPGQCPNKIQVGNGNDDDDDDDGKSSRAALKVALLGTSEVDVNNIDYSTVTLAGVPVSSVKIKDRYRADCSNNDDDDDDGGGSCKCKYKGTDYSDSCTNLGRKKDGTKDAELRFNRSDLVDALMSGAGGLQTATLQGETFDGTCIQGSDCVLIVMGGDDDDDDGDAVLPPSAVILGPALPNPFNPSTRITFSVPQATTVRLSVYDVKGRLVERLVQGTRAAGEHSVEFRADGLASGIYFYRLEVGNFVQTKKMILLK